MSCIRVYLSVICSGYFGNSVHVISTHSVHSELIEIICYSIFAPAFNVITTKVDTSPTCCYSCLCSDSASAVKAFLMESTNYHYHCPLSGTT